MDRSTKVIFYQCKTANKLVGLNCEPIAKAIPDTLTRNNLFFFFDTISSKAVMVCAKIVFTWILKVDVFIKIKL